MIGKLAAFGAALLLAGWPGPRPAHAQQTPPAHAQGPIPGHARAITMEEAIATALRQNRDLRDARLDLDASAGLVQEAWSNVFPSVDASASYVRNLSIPVNFLPAIFFDPDAPPGQLAPIRFGAENQWQLQLTAEQPLFRAAAFLGVGAAERYRALQQEAVRGTAQQIATRVRIAYYDVLLAQEELRLRENSLARIEATLSETEAMYRAGLSSEYDVLRLEVERNNIRPNVRRARNALGAARRTLAVELGLDPGDPPSVEGSLTGIPMEAIAGGGSGAVGESATHGAGAHGAATDGDGLGGVEGLLAVAGVRSPEEWSDAELVDLARERRSDLRQLDYLQRLRRTEVRVEKVGYLPTVTLFGNYSIQAQQDGSPAFFGETSAQRAYGRQVGVRVNVPIFSGLARPARIQQVRATLGQAEEQYRLAFDRAGNEVVTVAEQVREARERADAQRLAVGQALRGFDIARAQYREGMGSQLEVTDAELALRQSEFNYAEAVYDYLAARARLDHAAGTVPFVDTGDEGPLQTLGVR